MGLSLVLFGHHAVAWPRHSNRTLGMKLCRRGGASEPFGLFGQSLSVIASPGPEDELDALRCDLKQLGTRRFQGSE